MQRKSIYLLLVVALVGASASAQTVDELLAKNYQAKGGLEKIKSVKSARLEGRMTAGPGGEAPIVMEWKRPEMVRMEFTLQGMTGIQAYDGKGGWSLMPFLGKKSPEPMSEEDIKSIQDQADFDGPLVDYATKGNQIELEGKEDVDGSPAYKLKVTKKNGDVDHIYLDADAYLEVKQEGKRMARGQEIEYEVTLGDYKPVDGLMLAHSISSQAKNIPNAPAQQITIDKIVLNPDISDSEFAMPKVEPEAKPAGGGV